jgi:transposase
MNNIPLLPALVKRAKDAAWAVREGLHIRIHQVTENTLTQLLDLPGFQVSGYGIERQAEKDIVHLKCELSEEVAVCLRCKAVSSTVKQYQSRCVRDLDLLGKRTFLHFELRRFECPECGHRFTERLQAVDWRRRQTGRLEQAIYQDCLQSSKKAVAEKWLLGYSTVTEIFKRQARRSLKQQALQVRILGMDEIALKKRHKQYALVLSDLERRYVLAVLPSREQAEIEKWLKRLTDAQKQAIAVVSMDMWRPYRSFVQQHLSQAQIVADRFHVMKQLNDRLTKARRQIQRQADEDTQQALKGSRWLLVRARETLSPEQEQQLLSVLDADHQLRTAYLLKEEFRLIFERIQDQQQARRFLEAWVCKVQFTHNRYLLDFVKTLRNWWQEILNYFDKRITNGFVEGLNRAIRTIIWRAYGFRNFDNFKLQVLAEHGSPD